MLSYLSICNVFCINFEIMFCDFFFFLLPRNIFGKFDRLVVAIGLGYLIIFLLNIKKKKIKKKYPSKDTFLTHFKVSKNDFVIVANTRGRVILRVF